jgi:D-glycero-D-manno-heptose 1,7-bisphosphate phosphatase
MNAPAIFVDRDGTVIEDVGYISDPEAVQLVPGAAAALRALRRDGFRIVLVSNQSGIGRGYFSAEQAYAVHDRMVDKLSREGADIDDFRYCPHAPDAGCSCRKPLPGMLRQAAEALHLDLQRSFMIGDSAVDAAAGRAAGCRTILLRRKTTTFADCDFVARDWDAVVARIQACTPGAT